MKTETYQLTVPLAKSGTEGGDSRYSCCHRPSTQGHGESCTVEMRRGVIEAALTRAGFEFELQRDEDKQPGDEPTLAEVRESGSHATIPFREPLESGRMSSAESNLGQPPKGREDSPVKIAEMEHVADEDMRVTEAYAEKAGLKSLVEAVTEPNVIEELRTAQASITHALFRLGGE